MVISYNKIISYYCFLKDKIKIIYIKDLKIFENLI